MNNCRKKERMPAGPSPYGISTTVGGYPYRGSYKPFGYVSSPKLGQYGSQPSAASDAAYYGGMALGFGTAAYQNRAAIGAVAEAGMEMARGAMVAAI